MRELRTKHNLYLTMFEGETYEQAEDRLLNIICEAENANSGLSVSEVYDSEIQEYEE